MDMTSSSVALDVAASPAARARDLRLARERFLQDPTAVEGVRPQIVASWRRSAALGVDPRRRESSAEISEEDARAALEAHPLGPLTALLERTLSPIATGSENVAAVTDADGLILWVAGDPSVRLEAAEQMGFIPGARLSERQAGTNAIGTALATDKPLQVFASEHFCERSQWWTCAAAPVRDPRSGEILGTVDLTSRIEAVHPHTLGLVVTAAAMLEQALLAAEPQPAVGVEPAPLVEPLEPPPSSQSPVLRLDVLAHERAHVTLDGFRPAMSLRHSEILVLLAANPAGLTTEQLALALHGEAGKAVTARAEISRLRRVLGPCIQTEPYRLDAVVRADFLTVQDLLRKGQAGEALTRYRGPLLRGSEAPGVVELRNELDSWIRRAALADDDVEAMWSWLTTPSGHEDLQTWKRLLANLPHDDGRRGLAAARLERLRPLLAPDTAPRSGGR
jgi:hypothetical protein